MIEMPRSRSRSRSRSSESRSVRISASDPHVTVERIDALELPCSQLATCIDAELPCAATLTSRWAKVTGVGWSNVERKTHPVDG